MTTISLWVAKCLLYELIKDGKMKNKYQNTPTTNKQTNKTNYITQDKTTKLLAQFQIYLQVKCIGKVKK